MADLYFKNKKVLITGAGSGLGRLFCLSLTRSGSSVIALDRDAQKLSETAHLCGPDAQFESHVVDLTEGAQVAAFSTKIQTQLQKLDILILNAGVYHGGPFLDVPFENHLQTYRVNLEGCVRMTHHFLPLLKTTPHSQLLFLASITGLVGVPYATSYASSKWGVIGFAESLREELRETKSRSPDITVVCPSTIDTGMFAGTKPPLFLPLLKPEHVVTKSLEALKRRRKTIYLPFFATFVPFLKGILPRRLFDAVSDLMGVNSALRTWKGRQL